MHFIMALGSAAPAADKLAGKYNLIHLSVISSSPIASRTSAVIQHLTTQPNENPKPALISVSAKAPVANKLISIIEIAKRELARNQANMYQYSALSSETVPLNQLKGRMKRKTGDGGQKGNRDVESEEDAFETMGEKEQIRAVPVLTVYLSTVRIQELKEAYGYVLRSVWPV